jgi:hypothetical protein
MGRLYWYKHGVESVFVRIGSCFPEPVDARMLATWLSYPDLSRLVARCILAERVGCSVIWGASNNQRMTWWKDDARGSVGWQPLDSADPFAGQLAGKVSGNPVAERYMGGGFCALGYSAMRRHHNSYFNQEGDCARRSAVHRQSPVLIVVDARLAGGPSCATGRRGNPDPLQSAWTDPGYRDAVA